MRQSGPVFVPIIPPKPVVGLAIVVLIPRNYNWMLIGVAWTERCGRQASPSIGERALYFHIVFRFLGEAYRLSYGNT